MNQRFMWKKTLKELMNGKNLKENVFDYLAVFFLLLGVGGQLTALC